MLGGPDVVILASSAFIALALGILLLRSSLAESLGAFAFSAFLASGAAYQAGFPLIAIATGSALAPLAFGAAGALIDPLPMRRLWMATAAYAAVRTALGLLAPASAPHLLALFVEPVLLVAAAAAFARIGAGSIVIRLGCTGFLLLAAAEAVGHAAAIWIPDDLPSLGWIGAGFLAFGMLTASSLIRGREASLAAVRRLHETASRFEAIANSAHDLMAEMDDALRIVWISPSVRSVLGFSREEMIGHPAMSFLRSEDLEQVLGALDELSPGESTPQAAMRVRAKNGEWCWLDGAVRSYECGDGSQRFMMVARDVTARMQLEERLRAAQKEESLALLAGGIAHDFNNALMGILGNVEDMQRRIPAESELRAPLAEVETAADRATRLTDQLLVYAGGGTFRRQLLDLSAIAADMSRLLGRTFPGEVQIETKLATSAMIEGDDVRVREGLLALITNAREALGEAGGRIALSSGSLELDAVPLASMDFAEGCVPGPYVYLEVRDDGCGMEPETRQRLFDPFFTTREPGRGLGMASVLGLARLHGAAIEVATAVGHGTTIRLYFPEASAEALALPPESPAKVDPNWRAEGTVLVVDDEEPILRLARRALETHGLRVRVARNGREAVEIFRRHADEIRVVVMDVMMPEMRGDEAYLAIREYRADVPVIFSSGWSADEGLSRIPRDEVANFLPKPYRHDSLIACIQQVLDGDGS